MTEEFVMSLPKKFSKKLHNKALKNTFSPMSTFFEQAINTVEFNQQAYELSLSQDCYMRLTYQEDVVAKQTASVLRIYM